MTNRHFHAVESIHGRSVGHPEKRDEPPVITMRKDWLRRDALRSVEIATVIALFAVSCVLAGAVLI
ncbi:MAG: hypothetical protein B7Y89_04970 [Novosphingobium sp. 32-60-15]|nr:MAG: hypothetical protein B7Y89_04970 [Novosphingobium sp. 32-60-15]